MTFSASGGKITVHSSDGRKVFDTDEKLFYVTDTLVGSMVLPGRISGTAGSGARTWDVYTPIGTCHAASTFVTGAFKLTGVRNSWGLPADGWFAAGGSIVRSMVSTSYRTDQDAVSSVDRAYCPTIGSVLTFLVSSGVVYLRELTMLRPPSTSYTGSIALDGDVLDWKLQIGSFV